MNEINWEKVYDVVGQKSPRIPYEKNKHNFTRIAFDVFQLNSSPTESYWILEKDEDGEEYLVANYEKEPEEGLCVKSEWEALSDKESKNVTLLYKGMPIKRFASSEYNFNKDDVSIFKRALINKLNTNQEFVDKLMKILTEEKRNALRETFPELTGKDR